MIATSTVVMFILMYSTAYRFSHVWWSETRFWMALYMGSAMAIVMLGFMREMYADRKKNLAVFAGSALVLVGALFLARSQDTVDDVDWMKAMIPHHSIAILTSERAKISDPRVRRLADDIILAQRREIAEMEALIGDLEQLDYEREPIPPAVPPLDGGSEEVPGAPGLTVGDVVGEVVLLSEVLVTSDAWVVIHPATQNGTPDPSVILGKAFIRHGKTRNIPVGLETGVASGTTLYAMLHEDSGQIGVFEFGGSGTSDPPLMQNGSPVAVSFMIR